MNTTPAQLQQQLNKISDELYTACQEMAGISSKKGTVWLRMKQTTLRESKPITNAEIDKLWEASEDGVRENYLKWYIKGLQAKRGAILQEVKSNNQSY